MSDMSLQAEMRLDGANMLSGIQQIQGKFASLSGSLNGAAMEGVSKLGPLGSGISELASMATRLGPAGAAVVAACAAMAAGFVGLKNVINLGGELNDLSARTGIAVGDLLVLRQAFDETGVGAEAGVQAVTLMQRSLAGINEDGEPTNAMFKRLGLSMESLKSMSTTDQLNTIGAAIRGLSDPAERTAAAMGIFGRAGAQMNQFFADPEAMDTVRASLGEMPALMQKNAKMMDNIGDMWDRVKTKLIGLFAGMMDIIGPNLESIVQFIESIDWIALGETIGLVFKPIMAVIDSLGRLIRWFQEKWQALKETFGGEKMEMPEIIKKSQSDFASKLGTDTTKSDKEDISAGEHFLAKQRQAKIDELEGQAKINALLEERNRLDAESLKLREGSKEDWQNLEQIMDVDKQISNTKKAMQKGESQGGGTNIPTDQLARIGGFIGGGMGSADHGQKIAQNTEQTAKNVEKLAKEMEEYRNQPNNLVWTE